MLLKKLLTLQEKFSHTWASVLLIHKFYDDLFTEESPKNIILAMLSMLKTTRNADRISSQKIFLNVADKLKIDNHYSNINDLTSANCTTNCNDILKVLG